MNYIALIAVFGVVLLDFGGLFATSSVGGALALFFICIIATLVVGLHEAWLKKRGVLGWIMSIVVAVVGGLVAVSFFGLVVMEPLIGGLKLNGSLAKSQHPMRYISTAGSMIFTLLGSWLALWSVNRFR